VELADRDGSVWHTTKLFPTTANWLLVKLKNGSTKMDQLVAGATYGLERMNNVKGEVGSKTERGILGETIMASCDNLCLRTSELLVRLSVSRTKGFILLAVVRQECAAWYAMRSGFCDKEVIARR
jgi:hypothetical protein